MTITYEIWKWNFSTRIAARYNEDEAETAINFFVLMAKLQFNFTPIEMVSIWLPTRKCSFSLESDFLMGSGKTKNFLIIWHLCCVTGAEELRQGVSSFPGFCFMSSHTAQHYHSTFLFKLLLHPNKLSWSLHRKWYDLENWTGYIEQFPGSFRWFFPIIFLGIENR